ncbi:MAG: GNAT family N-acetyltransferase [Candidatus Bathyarchaeota archaeon]|nr:GNAT family N-acetyltransferase [Candidatus Bathyarchaeota archaeon]
MPHNKTLADCMNPQDKSLSRHIRKATPNDIDQISAIEKKCFEGPRAYAKRRLAYLALEANSTCLVMTEEGDILGFIIVLYRKGSCIANIETIDVDPQFQKQGIGMSLLVAAEADMKKRGMKISQLEVSERNEAAIKLYQKAGYTAKERLINYYKFEHCGTRHAIRMVKALN